MISTRHVHLSNAHKTPQFWLIWGVLCLNVTAGIGVIGMASPMLQEVFGGRLSGVDAAIRALDASQAAQIVAIAVGFTGLLSLFNIGGRFFWASMSDKLGRKASYSIFFLLGTQFVGTIHGRLLTAWSMAGISGPVIVNYLREFQLSQGVAKAQAYDTTMLILAALLVAGFLCNLLIRPVAPKWQMSDEEPGAASKLVHVIAPAGSASTGVAASTSPAALVLIAWLAVGIPLAWGVAQTVAKAAILFK